MKTTTTAYVLAAILLFVGGVAATADTPHAKPLLHEALPPLFPGASEAQAACPSDRIVWVNWQARISHLPDDRWYGHTVAGAYACAGEALQAGIQPAQ